MRSAIGGPNSRSGRSNRSPRVEVTGVTRHESHKPVAVGIGEEPSVDRELVRRACNELAVETEDFARSTGWKTGPASTWPRGWSWYSNEVTTPKLPPPPRSAQNRSACDVALACRRRPSAATTSASKLSHVSPCLPFSQTLPAAEGQTSDAGRSHDTARRCQTERLRLTIKLSLSESGLGAHRSGHRIDTNTLHQREVDDQPPIAEGLPSDIVTATADGHEKAIGASEVDRGDDIGGAGAARDERGIHVDHRVPDLTNDVIALIRRLNHVSAERLSEQSECFGSECDWSGWRCLMRCHRSLPLVRMRFPSRMTKACSDSMTACESCPGSRPSCTITTTCTLAIEPRVPTRRSSVRTDAAQEISLRRLRPTLSI